MSDAVLIAITTAVCTALPLVLAQAVALVKTLKRADKIDQKIEAVKQTAKIQHEEIDLMKTGAFRAGHVAGMEYQRAQSDFSKLSGK